MTSICWWLVERLSRALDPDERDAVRGDFAEAGVSGGKALLDLLGLVARRQAALWGDWRPWLALVGIVGPGGLMLVDFSISLGRGYNLPFWFLWNYNAGVVSPQILEQTGLLLRPGIARFVCHCLPVVSWSWTGGFVLASLSRRTIWVNGALFCALVSVFFSFVLRSPGPPQADTVVLLSAALFLVPFFWGVRQGLRLGTLKLLSAILLTAAITGVAALAIWTGGWRWGGGAWARMQLLLSLALCWPVVYLLATAGWRQWRNIIRRVGP